MWPPGCEGRVDRPDPMTPSSSQPPRDTLNIVYVITRMIVGGAQETAKHTAEHFHREGHQVLLVTGPEGGREGTLEVAAPTLTAPWLVRALSPMNDLRVLWFLYQLFRRRRPDVVHARTAKARLLAVIPARLVGVPLVVQTLHGYSFNNQIDSMRRVYVLLEKLAARLYHSSVFVSEADVEEGRRLGIVKDRVVPIIRSGVDVDKMRNVSPEAVAAIRATYAPEQQLLVTLVGRLSRPKTPEVFVEAAALVTRTHPSVRFLVVGDGSKREEVAELIKRLRLDDKVVMLGLRADVGEVMAASDIVVHSSTHEGLPKTVLEGMVAGRPVIGTRTGGVPIVVTHNTTGLLVDKCDVGQLAEAITKYLDDPVLCQQVVTNANRRIQEFTLGRTVEATGLLYESLLAGHMPTGGTLTPLNARR